MLSEQSNNQRINIENLKTSVNIVDVLDQHVDLEKRGGEYFGLCPFHDDHKRSLKVNDDKQIFKCFACGAGGDVIDFFTLQGMNFKDACKVVAGKQISDNYPNQQSRLSKQAKVPKLKQVIPAPQQASNEHALHPKFGQQSAAWQWLTADGKLVGYTLRYDHNDGKAILPLTWQKSDDFEGWKFKGFEVPRMLYNLPDLKNRPEAPLLIVEGEKCVEAAKKLFPTLVITTWMGGAQAIEHTDWSPVYGRDICLWPDNDVPGRDAMDNIAKILIDKVPVIKRIKNPESLPNHWDVADTNWTQTQAIEFIKKNIYQVHPETEPPEPSAAKSSEIAIINHSKVLDKMMEAIPQDVDFRTLVNLQEDEKLKTRHYIVYSVKKTLQIATDLNWDICTHNESVYLFNGCYWSRIEEDELKRFLGEAAKKMGWEESYSDHFQQRDHLFKQFVSEAYFPAPKRDNNRVLINLKNGTFEIKSNETRLREFDPKDFLTHQLPFEYDPDAQAVKFEKYLSEVLPDESLRKVLQEYAGYLFVPTVSLKLEKILMLLGSGANGKSVFFDILKALVGRDNFSTYSLQSLTSSNGYYRADLADRLVNYASEISGRIETSYFKTLASGEPIEARLPYKNPITIHDYAKLIFNVNELPYDVEHTEGFFRRFLIIPFEVTISEDRRDRNLAKTIVQEELPGVFNWVLKGLHRLLKQGNFTESEKVNHELQSYRRESDSVALYMDDSGYTKSLTHWKSQKELYRAYRNYVLDNGFKPVSNIKFGKRLENIGFLREAKSIGKVVYAEKELAPF